MAANKINILTIVFFYTFIFSSCTNSSTHYCYKGEIELANNNPQKAEVLFKHAIQLDSTNIRAYYFLSDTYVKMGKIDKSIYILSKALYLPHKNVTFYKRGISYLTSNKIKLALIDFSSAIKQNPTDINSYLERANCYLYMKRYDSSLIDLATILNINPTNEVALNNRAFVYWEMGKYQKALNDFTLSLKYKKDTSTYTNRAKLYNQIGKKTNSRKDLKIAISLGSTEAYKYLNDSIN